MIVVAPLRVPRTWLFVDDEERFLDSLKLDLPERQPSAMFSNPHEFLNFFSDDAVDRAQWREHNHLSSDLEGLSFNLDRFRVPSVLIVDYSMPGIDGLSLLNQIDIGFSKVILLTGVADEHTAIDAFNCGLIDQYIRKGERNAVEKLIESARNLTSEFDAGFGEVVVDQQIRELILSDEFNKAFNSLGAKYDWVEHYFCSNPLGFYCISFSGERMFLFLIHSNALEQMNGIAQFAPSNLQGRLNDRSCVTQIFEKFESRNRYDWETNTGDVLLTVNEHIVGVQSSPPISINTELNVSLKHYLEVSRL